MQYYKWEREARRQHRQKSPQRKCRGFDQWDNRSSQASNHFSGKNTLIPIAAFLEPNQNLAIKILAILFIDTSATYNKEMGRHKRHKAIFSKLKQNSRRFPIRFRLFNRIAQPNGS